MQLNKILFIATLLFSEVVFAQGEFSVSGKVIDSETSEPVLGAVVLMISVKDTTDFKFITTDFSGNYVISGLERSFYRIKISSLAYKPYTKVIRIAIDQDLGSIKLAPDTKMLGEIEIKGDVIAVETRGDTTVYNADAFKVNPDATLGDLVKKMPGITVDDSGVQANGETIEQVLLDGKRFFGQDPLLALNTIPAEVVKSVEILDQKSEQSQFTGFDDGNTTKTMNVVTREDKRNGVFGKVKAGYGTDNRRALEGNINHKKKDFQYTILAMSNNINQKSFSDSDIMGVGRDRGRRNRFGGGQSNSQQQGITQTQSGGLNFSNELKNKGLIEGSYFFDRSKFENEQVTSRETFFDQGSQFYDEVNEVNSSNMNHRVNMRIKYDFNDNNSIVFTPRLTFQNNTSEEYTNGKSYVNDDIQNTTENTYRSDNIGYNLNGDLLFKHKLNAIGRSILVNVGTTINDNDKENIFDEINADSSLLYLDTLRNRTWRTNLSYIEPIGMSSQLQINYDVTNGNKKSNRDTYSFVGDNDLIYEETLSNHFDNQVLTQTPSISLTKRGYQRFLNMKLAYQNTRLQNIQQFPTEYNIQKQYNAILPSLMSRLQFGSETNGFFRFNTQISIPSERQLQTVVDNSNPFFFSVGNPNLDQSYSTQFLARISKSNIEKSTSFSNFIFTRNTMDYITNAIFVFRSDTTLSNGIVLPAGTQLSSPVNLDGYWSVRDNATWGFLLSKLKTNLNLSVGVSYTRLPGLSNGVENFSNTYNVNTKVSFNSNISENVDFDTYYSTSLNRVFNSIQEQQNSRYATHNLGGKLNLIFSSGTVFRTNLNYQIYDGVSEEFDTQFLLWNMSIAQKFMKNRRAEVSITVFDLLDQNKGVSQTIGANYIEETRSLVLEQYFMLSVTYNIRKFL
jgi:hypothetical protein